MNELMLLQGITMLGFLVLLLICVVLWQRMRRYQSEIDRLGRAVEEVKRNLHALCSSAVGVNRRMVKLEQGERELYQRQDHIEQQGTTDRPYAEAIRIAQQGGSAERLVEEFGLSRSEADLIVMLHGMKELS